MCTQFKKLRDDTRGNVLIITAFSIFFMIAVTGAAVDFGRFAIVKLRTQQAIDAAAIAIAALPASASATDQQNTLVRYFSLNYSSINQLNSFAGVTITPADLSLTTGNTISVSVTKTVPTLFLKFVGIDTLAMTTTNKIQSTSATATNYDMIFVFDNSGSMCAASDTAFTGYANCAPAGSQRIDDLRNAAETLANKLLTPGSSNQIGIVTWDNQVVNTPQPLTTNVATISNYLKNMNYVYGGGTDSSIGFTQAQNLAHQFRASTVHIIVYFTDGSNTSIGGNNEVFCTQSCPPPVCIPRLGCFPYQCVRCADPDAAGTGVYNCNSLNDAHNWSEEKSDAATQAIATQFKATTPPTFIYTVAVNGDISNGCDAAYIKHYLSTVASGVPDSNDQPDANGNQYFYITNNNVQISDAFNQIFSGIKKIKFIQ